MKNFLIILGILAVGYLAVIDTLERFKEIEDIAVVTPSQIEMQSDFKKTAGEGIDKNNSTNYGNPQNSKFPNKRLDNIMDQTQTTEIDMDGANLKPQERWKNPPSNRF